MWLGSWGRRGESVSESLGIAGETPLAGDAWGSWISEMKHRFPELHVNQCDQDVVRTTHPGHTQCPPWPESCCPGHRHLAGALVVVPSPGFFQVAWKSLCPIGVFTWDGDTMTQLDPLPWEVQTEQLLCPKQGGACRASPGARLQRTVLQRNLSSRLPGSSRTSPLPCKSSHTQASHVLQPSRRTLCFGVPVTPAGAPFSLWL